METFLKTTKDTQKLALQLARHLRAGDIVALYGDLGSGKTTFTSYLVSALGFSARVQSPTFVLVRHYSTSNPKYHDIKEILHLDMYRLTSKEEALDLGFEDFMSQANTLMVIEWPEVVEDLLPRRTIKVHFNMQKDGNRKVHVTNL